MHHLLMNRFRYMLGTVMVPCTLGSGWQCISQYTTFLSHSSHSQHHFLHCLCHHHLDRCASRCVSTGYLLLQTKEIWPSRSASFPQPHQYEPQHQIFPPHFHPTNAKLPPHDVFVGRTAPYKMAAATVPPSLLHTFKPFPGLTLHTERLSGLRPVLVHKPVSSLR